MTAAGCRFDLPESLDSATVDALPAGFRTAETWLNHCTTGMRCPLNTIPLHDLGIGGIPGASITFISQAVGSSISLTDIKLITGPRGAYIEHPLFISIPSDTSGRLMVDSIDRFRDLTINVPSSIGGNVQQFGPGGAFFVDFLPQNKLVILFEAAMGF